MAISALSFTFLSTSPRILLKPQSCCFQVTSQLRKEGHGRRVWRRRQLTKKDDMVRYNMERVPFLEEQVRKIKDGGKLLTMDIERLLLSEDNRYDFVNEIAAEAKEYVENNREEYGDFFCLVNVTMNLASTCIWLQSVSWYGYCKEQNTGYRILELRSSSLPSWLLVLSLSFPYDEVS
ncbi:hypothetical protein QYF36_015357 [Acer negundo]|nr:hypothetical protein QYF36_015357 [Acer negundo]